MPGLISRCGGGTPLKVTNGFLTVDPTTEIFIGSGLTLTNPAAGEAQIVATTAAAGYENFDSSLDKTIAAGASDFVPFYHASGSSLVVLTSHDVPTVKAAGVYALTVSVAVSPALTVGTSYRLTLTLNHTLGFAAAQKDVGALTPPLPSGDQEDTIGMTAFMPLGAALFVTVANNDSIGHDFNVQLGSLQKIT